jgi:hypothetical protein
MLLCSLFIYGLLQHAAMAVMRCAWNRHWHVSTNVPVYLRVLALHGQQTGGRGVAGSITGAWGGGVDECIGAGILRQGEG